MKKIYFLAAACAAMSMASCSTETLDETVLQSDSNLISFNVNAGKSTKADITTANITKFSATAIINGSTTKYFDNEIFAKNGQTFNSADPYYWPQNVALDFFAYAPITASDGKTLTRSDYMTFTVRPNQNENADYVDFIYANTDGKTKANSGANGVQINFRHAESKIVVKVKNSAANLQFDVKGWRIGYLSGSGEFTYADTNTDGNNSDLLTYEQWDNRGIAYATNTYTKTFGVKTIPANTSTSVALDGEMILIPQTVDMATKYKDGLNAAQDTVAGSYIGLDLKIYNTNQAKTVIFDGTHNGYQNLWAAWPVNIDWQPGKKYTYTIDLCGGGYYERNQTDINSDNADLDPILGDDAIIKFVDVTVDDWNESFTDPQKQQQEVNMLLTNPIENAVASFKPLSDGTITYSGDQAKTVTLTATTADFQWPGYPSLEGTNPDLCNITKDIRSFFDGLYYTGSPVKSVTYNTTEYTNNEKLVYALTHALFEDNFWDTDKVKAGSASATVTINGLYQDVTSGLISTTSPNKGAENVTLVLRVGPAEKVMYATEIAQGNKQGEGVFSSTDGTSVKLTAPVGDFKWPGFPTVEGKDTNNNPMFKNVENFCKALFTVGFNSVSFKSVSYTSATATDLAAALAGDGFSTFWNGGDTIETKTFSTSLTADGTPIPVSLTAE